MIFQFQKFLTVSSACFCPSFGIPGVGIVSELAPIAKAWLLKISAILQEYEANQRILIKGVPVRADLKWRAKAIEIPNFDLLDDCIISELQTLDWRDTYDFLVSLYESNNNRYKFNFLLAPLGSKMQTVGAWLFAKERREVKVVSSTPKMLFHDKYSIGHGKTFFFDDLPQRRAASRDRIQSSFSLGLRSTP
jgi:hypothetical protein